MCLLKGYHSKLPGMKSPKMHVLYCKHDVKGDLSDIICTVWSGGGTVMMDVIWRRLCVSMI